MTKKIYQGDGWSFNPGSRPKKKSSAILPREKPKPKILLEKRKNNKIVTVIKNLQINSQDIKELASQLKTFCGTGGTAKYDTIELQGDFTQKVQGWLKEKGWI